MSAPRIKAAEPPFSDAMTAQLEKVMPLGVPPLVLFTTLARDPRLFGRFMGAGLLDKGQLSLRQREIIIHRVTGRSGSEYEWGVHAAFFAARVGLDDSALAATVRGAPDDHVWTAQERLLIELCDGVLAGDKVDDALWAQLSAHYSDVALLEMLMLIGFYRTVSTLTIVLRLPLEPFGRRFDSV